MKKKFRMGEVDEEPAALASTDPSLPIQKKVLHAGRGELPEYKDGTKVLLRAVLWIRIRIGNTVPDPGEPK